MRPRDARRKPGISLLINQHSTTATITTTSNGYHQLTGKLNHPFNLTLPTRILDPQEEGPA